MALTKHKTSIRTCISCRKCDEQKNMLRIVKSKENQVSVDLKGKEHGRGAYMCKNISCIINAEKTKALSKAFKTNINDKIYKDIRRLFEND